jgi:exodeoxyribonuclease VII small subunit
MMTKKSENFVFEDALEQLDVLVKQLESGDMPLEKALESFEQGSTLIKTCQKKLDDASMRVEKIMKNQSTEN